MAQPYFVPQSLANIYQRAADEQAQYIDQPKGLAAALPQLGQTFLQATDIYKQQQQKRSMQQAQQMYSNYLAKVDNGSATPEDHAMGRMAAMSLGIAPPDYLGIRLKNSEIEKNTAQAHAAEASSKKTPKTLEQIQAESAARAAGTGAGERNTQAEWDKLNRQTNPSVAPRGSLLGIAAQNNSRADRALSNLNDPNMVVQQLDAVTTDIAGVMQGGSPHESGIAGQNFKNILTRWASIKSQLTSSPQAINNPATALKLRQIVNDIKRVDNKIITDNLRTNSIAFKGIIQKDPQRWTDYQKSVLETTQAATDTPEQNSGGGVDLQSAAQAELARRGIK